MQQILFDKNGELNPVLNSAGPVEYTNIKIESFGHILLLLCFDVVILAISAAEMIRFCTVKSQLCVESYVDSTKPIG